MRDIISRVSSNCLSSWFTSCIEVPLPWAMRFLRLPLMMSGFLRSFTVMDWMMTFARISLSSSMSSLFTLPAMPGSIFIMSPMPPIFFTLSSCSR